MEWKQVNGVGFGTAVCEGQRVFVIVVTDQNESTLSLDLCNLFQKKQKHYHHDDEFSVHIVE